MVGSVIIGAVILAGAFGLTRKEPVADCPPGTSWFEDEEPARHAGADEEPPGRVGWCVRPDGTRHGAMRSYRKSGWLAREVHFVDGAETGPMRVYFADGRPHIEATQRDGKLDGLYVQWHPNGQRARSMHYADGRAHGLATYWSEAGRVTSQGTFFDGKKHGTWEAWHPNGVFRELARWEDGRLHGRQLGWNEGGIFVIGSCWEAGEKRWESRTEGDSRTRACRPW